MGEHCKLPQRGLGRSPSGKQIWCLLAWKSDFWWHQFRIFPTFPWLLQNIFFPGHSNSRTFSSFPWPGGTLDNACINSTGPESGVLWQDQIQTRIILGLTFCFCFQHWMPTVHCVSKKMRHFVTVHYLRQILTNLQNSFTGTFCIQFAITQLLNIPPHLKCDATLPCEI